MKIQTKYIVIISILFFSKSIFSQENIKLEFDNYLSFYSNVNIQDSYREKNIIGEKQLFLKPFLSFESGFEFHKKINSYLEYGLGLKFGLIPFNQRYFINNDSMLISVYGGNYNQQNREFELYLAPSLSLKINLKQFKKQTLYTELGVNLILTKYYDSDRGELGIGDSIGQEIKLYEFTLLPNPKKFHASLFLRVGMSKKIKNRIFNYGITANYMPGYIRKGTFAFYNISNPSSGEIKMKLNYIGFFASYGISLNKKNELKEME